MANNIKGITVEIGGNTGPLNSALKDVNKTAGGLQSELKEVNKQLKFDPKNTALLKQKQDLLAKSADELRNKEAVLKSAVAQAQEQFEKGDLGADKVRAVEREYEKVKSQLKDVETQAKQASSVLSQQMENLGSNISNAGEKISGVGKSLAPVSAAAAGALAGSVAAYKEVDAGADIVIEKTGATGDAAKEMEAVYKDVASSVPDSMEEVGSAVGEINTRLEFTGDKLKTASEDFLKFAKINNIDVNTSVQLVSRAMGDANIPASEYKTVLDQLTVAGQKSGISMETLTTDLAKYGAPMRALGLDTQTSIAMFSGWEKAGVNTEIAFSGMKKAISNWSAQGKDSRVEFKKTLDEIKKAPDISTATTEAIKVFGQKAGPDLADAIRGGRFEVQDYIDALQNAGGSVDSTYAGIKDGTDDAKTAMNAAKVAASELGGTVMSSLAPVLQSITGKIKELTLKFRAMSPAQRELIVKILAVVAAIAPVLIIVGKVTSSIGGLITTGGKLVGFLGGKLPAALSLVQKGVALLLANPAVLMIMAVVAAVTLLVVGIKHLWDTNEGFRNAVTKAWNGLKDLATTVGGAIKSAFTSGVNFIKKLPSEALQWGKDIINGIANGIKNAAHAVGDAVKGVAQNIRKFLHFSEPDEGPLVGFHGWWKDMMYGMADDIRSNLDPVKSAVKLVAYTVAENSPAAWNSGTKVSTAINAASGAVSAGGSRNASTSTVKHTGTIRVVGVNSKNEVVGVTKLIAKQTQQDARCHPNAVAFIPE